MNKEVIMVRSIKRMQNATAVILLLASGLLGVWGGYMLADMRRPRTTVPDFTDFTVAPVPYFTDFTVDVCAQGAETSRFPNLESYVAVINDRPRHRIIYVPCVGPVRTEPE